jgi:hypothetical protein
MTVPTPCEPCLKGKQTRSEIPKQSATRADTVLGRIHSDVCGPLPTQSHSGFRYFATFIDDKSRKVSVVGMREKSDLARHLKAFVARVELETGQKVRILRSDGGGEYIGKQVNQFLVEKGITHEITTPDTPQQNGVAERMNRTLLDKVRAILTDATLPDSYWFDALEHAALLRNLSPTRALIDKTPEEAWSGTKPDVSSLRVFGARAFVHIPDKHHDKLGAKSLVCTFLGYAPNRKAYRLVHRATGRFLVLRDVIFDEGGQIARYERVVFEHDSADVPGSNPLPSLSPHPPPLAAPIPTPAPPPRPTVEDVFDDDTPLTPLTPSPPLPSDSIAATRPRRNIRPPARYTATEHANVAQVANTEPRTYAEADENWSA